MTVKEKYSSATENDVKKLVLSNGAFAVCEMIELLIAKINHLRMSLNNGR